MQRHLSLAPQSAIDIKPQRLPPDQRLARTTVVCPSGSTWSEFMPEPLPAFSPLIVSFVDALARQLQAQSRQWPDLAALGFFLRPAALRQALKNTNTSRNSVMPLGLTFHLVPSNIPTVAFYSWLAALLQGNSAIIRLSSRQDPLQDAMISLLNALFSDPQWQAIAARTRFIRYERDHDTTAYFSAACAMRVVWGGNDTIRDIAGIALPPQAKELRFADRKSIAVIEFDYLQQLNDQSFEQLLRGLAKDMGQYNQQACASPVLVAWIGQPTTACWQRFWRGLSQYFPDNACDSVEQLVNGQLAACDGGFESLFRYKRLTLGQVRSADYSALCRFGGGIVAWQICDSLASWLEQHASFQTCVYVGRDQSALARALSDKPNMRIDRITTPGRALAFDWLWDGTDMLRAFSREISLS